jgi:hypothetical protein
MDMHGVPICQALPLDRSPNHMTLSYLGQERPCMSTRNVSDAFGHGILYVMDMEF